VTLRLVSYNIRYGGNGREAAIADTLRRCEPDVVVLQEATRPDVVDRIADACGLPHRLASPAHSVGFMSRVPVARHAWHRPRPMGRAVLELVLADRDVSVFGVHLTAVHSRWAEGRRVRELSALLELLRPHDGAFHVLAGDFNTLAPGERLDRWQLPPHLHLVSVLGGAIRWRTIQAMLDAGYADGYRTLHPLGPGHTFPTWSPHLRLDYVFVPEAHRTRLRACDVVTDGPRGASDHFPLLAELEL